MDADYISGAYCEREGIHEQFYGDPQDFYIKDGKVFCNICNADITKLAEAAEARADLEYERQKDEGIYRG